MGIRTSLSELWVSLAFAGVVKGRLAILAVADFDFGYACSVKIALRIASETRACYGP